MARRRPIDDDEVWELGAAGALKLDGLLRRLIALHFTEPILSLYLNLRWADEHQRERVWITVRDRVRELKAQHPNLVADLDEVLAFTEERVKQRADVGYGGAALFLSRRMPLRIAVRSVAELPTLLAAESEPLVRPLVAAARAHERCIVALAASDEVRVYELAMGELMPASAHVGDVPSRHAQGGWSQLKMQHHRREHIDALHREAAEAIAKLFDAAGPVRVLLGGVAEVVANLERVLPKRVAAAALRLESLHKDDAAHEVVAAAQSLMHEVERAEEQQVLQRVETLALSGGRGALGMKQVVEALNQARPMRVFVPDDSDGVLSICESCRNLSLEADGACDVCGGPRHQVDAAEGLVRAALGLGAKIDVVDRSMLDAVGGAAAELRF
jgi:hypothetical protein